jgi:D-sedoheptulose 7-phosphate isomerase
MTQSAHGIAHIRRLQAALVELEPSLPRLQAWSRRLAEVLRNGGRLLTVGNGGSAAEAQHLAAELVGRFRDDREPFSAIAIGSETASLTAIANDYGLEEAFARQVVAHGRPGDMLLAFSTSGASPNVLAAARAAAARDLLVCALTGAGPNALAELAHDAVCVEGDTATVQEVHLVCVHLLCAAVEPEDEGAGRASLEEVA